MTQSYEEFLAGKRQLGGDFGFDPGDLPDYLFDFQRDLVRWALRKGRAAVLADCGLGKSPMQLVWADAVASHVGKPVLIGTPLAVSHQVIQEGEKFGLEVVRSQDGTVPKGARLVVTNYERLAGFDPSDFAGFVADESSILKNFNGTRKAEITEFMRLLPYRLLCTATAAPNDYTELGTSSEALGHLGYMDMLGRFFTNRGQFVSRNGVNGARIQGKNLGNVYRLKGHAEMDFWRWVCSWARACRKPSDLGYPDDGFILPPLEEREHVVKARTRREGLLFDLPAQNLQEEREERRRTLDERCEKVAELVDHGDQALVWCHLNAEGDRLASIIDGAEQVQGSDKTEDKEARLLAFQRGDLRVLVTKPKLGAWGLNLQRCAHVTFFPSHSYEQYYQGVHRCWRFGQKRSVRVDVVATEGEAGVAKNLQRKSAQADEMFDRLVASMADAMTVEASKYGNRKQEVPAWL